MKLFAIVFFAVFMLLAEGNAAATPPQEYELGDEEIDRVEDQVESEDGKITQVDKDTGPVEDTQTAGQGKSWTW